MSWRELQPKSQKKARVKMSVGNAQGHARAMAQVIISSAEADLLQWGKGARFKVWFGEGPSYGKLRVQLSERGSFAGRYHKGAIVIRVGYWDGLPNERRSPVAVSSTVEDGAMVIDLPKDWTVKPDAADQRPKAPPVRQPSAMQQVRDVTDSIIDSGPKRRSGAA